VRRNLLYESSILNLSEKSKAIYEQAIEIALLEGEHGRTNSAQKIFEAMENSKAYLLSEAVQRAKILGYTTIPEPIVLKEDSFRTKIKVLEAKRSNLLVRTNDSTALVNINDLLFTTKEAFEEYKLSQSTINSNTDKQKNSLQIDDFKEYFSKKTLIIEYFAGKEGLYAIAINPARVKIYTLGTYKESVEEFVLAIKQLQNLAANDYQDIAAKLYSLTLAPILHDFEQVNSLVIIPDKQLGYISFDALVTEPVKSPNYSSLNYLVKDYTLMQHESVGLYLNHQEYRERAPQPFIGFAPDFNKDELNLLATTSRTGSNNEANLKSLPFARQEVELISKLLSGKAAIDTLASEAYFKKSVADFDILHVATHAIIDESNPLYSKLIFAVGDSLQQEDGRLHSFEIYGLKLNCDLVTLSACNTGSGKYLEGEGIYSLGRGFLMAGAKSVLTSLWEVSDQSTSIIMASFYAYLKKGQTSPEALRKAKLDYLTNADPLTANPYYWAGFVYIGRPASIYSPNRFYYWLGGFMLLIIGAWLTRKKKIFAIGLNR
jgi:CHAT domain-containing protein